MSCPGRIHNCGDYHNCVPARVFVIERVVSLIAARSTLRGSCTFRGSIRTLLKRKTHAVWPRPKSTPLNRNPAAGHSAKEAEDRDARSSPLQALSITLLPCSSSIACKDERDVRTIARKHSLSRDVKSFQALRVQRSAAAVSCAGAEHDKTSYEKSGHRKPVPVHNCELDGVRTGWCIGHL